MVGAICWSLHCVGTSQGDEYMTVNRAKIVVTRMEYPRRPILPATLRSALLRVAQVDNSA